MSVLSVSSFIDLFYCPYRVTFKECSPKLDSPEKVKAELYSGLFDYGLYLKLNKTTVTKHKLSQRLNYLWDELKPSISCVMDMFHKLSISSKIDYFLSNFANINNVIYFDHPREITIGTNSLLYNFYSFTQDYSIKSFVKIESYYDDMTCNSSCVRILSNLIKKDLKLLDDNLRHNVYFFRCPDGAIYYPNLVNKKELDSSLDSLKRVIDSKSYLPINGSNCKWCNHKSDCSWNYK